MPLMASPVSSESTHLPRAQAPTAPILQRTALMPHAPVRRTRLHRAAPPLWEARVQLTRDASRETGSQAPQQTVLLPQVALVVRVASLDCGKRNRLDLQIQGLLKHAVV